MEDRNVIDLTKENIVFLDKDVKISNLKNKGEFILYIPKYEN